MWSSKEKLAQAAFFVSAIAVLSGSPTAASADICPEPNHEAANACSLRAGSNASGDLESNADADRYRIELDDGQTVAVSLAAPSGNHKLRLETSDGIPVAEVGQGPGVRRLVAERLPAGSFLAYVASDDVDQRTERSYEISWRVEGRGDPSPVLAPTGRALRDLTLNAADAGEKAVQTDARLIVANRGRAYQAVFERENTQPVRKLGPMYILNRVYVGESADDARTIYAEWNLDDLPEADAIARPYTSLGDQPMPWPGDESRVLGACFKCDEENPLRHYRVVARTKNVVWLLYTWGRDSGGNFNVVQYLVDKLIAKL